MSPSRARYVTACQQLLALGVVVMALVPATRVVSLDVVGVQPGQGVASRRSRCSRDQAATSRLADYARGSSAGRPACGSRSASHRTAPVRVPRGRAPGPADQPKRRVTRSASAIASSRAGSAPVTRTSEPLETSGRVKAATPGGEAGFAADRSRSAPVEFAELPAATELREQLALGHRPVHQRHVVRVRAGRTA